MRRRTDFEHTDFEHTDFAHTDFAHKILRIKTRRSRNPGAAATYNKSPGGEPQWKQWFAGRLWS
jgi:hypothetical protein